MMMRAIVVVLAAALLCLTGPSNAWLIQGGVLDTGKQLFLGRTTTSPAGDRYFAIGSVSAASTTSVRTLTFPVAGSFKSMKINAVTTLSGAGTYVSTIYKNGVATAATCTISTGTQTCNWTGSVSVAAGDYASIFIHPASSPTGSVILTAVGFSPTTAGDSVIFASAGSKLFSTTLTKAMPIGSYDITPGAVSTGPLTAIVPENGTVDRLFVETVAPGTGGSGKSYAYSLVKNNSGASVVTTTVSDAATTGNDTTHTLSVVAGDSINFQGVPSGTPTASDASMGARFAGTTTAGYQFNTWGNGPSNTSTQYLFIADGTVTNTEANATAISNTQTFTKLRISVSNAPGSAASGKKWTFTLRKGTIGGSQSDTALTCDILETATSCSATGSVAVNDNDLINLSIVPTNTPTGPFLGTALLATR